MNLNYFKAQNKVRPFLKTQEKDFHIPRSGAVGLGFWVTCKLGREWVDACEVIILFFGGRLKRISLDKMLAFVHLSKFGPPISWEIYKYDMT